MGDKHLDTSKDSLESSVKDPIPIPSESNDTSNGARDSLLNDDKFQRALNDWCNLAQQNSMLSIKMMTRKKESDEFIKFSVKDLVPIPSESEDLSDIESECDMPVCDDFMTFSNPLFDSNDYFTSSDDESLSDEDVLEENFKIYSNPLFDEEIISTKIDPHHFNAESDLIESLLNQDTSIVSSLKFDSLLEEFSGELIHINLISPEIDEADSDPEEEIRLVEKLLYDNSSSRPPEELNSKNSDVVIESFSPSHIPVEDSNSLMEEIDAFLAPDDSIPPGIKNDDYD
ncbi:hypothetical protein Tco_0963025 [Tanacetum coccineum]